MELKSDNRPESIGYYDLEPLSKEDQEVLLDKMLEQLLTSEAAVKINEGNNGIILEVDTSGLAGSIFRLTPKTMVQMKKTRWL